MKRHITLILASIFILTMSAGILSAQDDSSSKTENKQIKSEDKLVVIWSSADKDVAIRMVFMYVYNAKKYGWWDDITLLVWGPSAQLLTQDIDLQEYLKKIKEIGIELKACKACADITGASDNLISQGVDVKYMGVELTNYIKEGRHILTF